MVEVASNDGYLLQHAAAAGIPGLGIEPSVNVGVIARERGVPTVSAFLDEPLARRVRAEYGPADLVVANNVYARVPNYAASRDPCARCSPTMDGSASRYTMR